MKSVHDYTTTIRWTGNRGEGTRAYKGYERNWNLEGEGKPVISCSNDPLLGGNAEKYNPEDLLLAAVASCHMLWFLHLASNLGIVIESYEDNPVAKGEMEPSGKGRFVSCTLRPVITVSEGNLDEAYAIHERIHEFCFIARSVAFPIDIQADIQRT
ncbi:OsmC family protein [Salaquimonas pukyongi]|uniref:OsmC family protein n=1 Tax=Salaquimonas pukyongi TaxID=2712698 RepID=UPI00096B6F25|nr:OsmC family protein [Salaquimonas pukyongi]